MTTKAGEKRQEKGKRGGNYEGKIQLKKQRAGVSAARESVVDAVKRAPLRIQAVPTILLRRAKIAIRRS